jgi:hypothetical protein
MDEIELKDFSELEQKLIQGFKRGLSNFKNFKKKDLLEMSNIFNKIIEYERKFIPGL